MIDEAPVPDSVSVSMQFKSAAYHSPVTTYAGRAIKCTIAAGITPRSLAQRSITVRTSWIIGIII